MKIEFGFWTWGRELREERGGVLVLDFAWYSTSAIYDELCEGCE